MKRYTKTIVCSTLTLVSITPLFGATNLSTQKKEALQLLGNIQKEYAALNTIFKADGLSRYEEYNEKLGITTRKMGMLEKIYGRSRAEKTLTNEEILGQTPITKLMEHTPGSYLDLSTKNNKFSVTDYKTFIDNVDKFAKFGLTRIEKSAPVAINKLKDALINWENFLKKNSAFARELKKKKMHSLLLANQINVDKFNTAYEHLADNKQLAAFLPRMSKALNEALKEKNNNIVETELKKYAVKMRLLWNLAKKFHDEVNYLRNANPSTLIFGIKKL